VNERGPKNNLVARVCFLAVGTKFEGLNMKSITGGKTKRLRKCVELFWFD
jgi:hypothetical protein